MTTMQSSFRSFGFGLFLSVLLVYLVLVAQFSSFVDPFLIVLAVPTGLVGVMLTLAFTDTTLNIQSLMGIVMLTGMVVSNSILIVDFANRLRVEGRGVRDAVAHSCRIRLRPILMTSLATDRRPAAYGVEAGNRQRGLRTISPRHHRGSDRFGSLDDLCCSRRLPMDLSAPRRFADACGRGGPMKTQLCLLILAAAATMWAASSQAQSVKN